MNVRDLITPVGTSSYPYLTGQGDTAFSNEGQYHVKLKIKKQDAELLILKIKNCIAAEVAELSGFRFSVFLVDLGYICTVYLN